MSELTVVHEKLFWYWIKERHSIFLRRQAGVSKPWTDDHILQDYKFTNPFRENDRGTVWLREHFLEPHRNFTHSDFCASQGAIGGQGLEFIPCNCQAGSNNLKLLAFNICWYRMFNWWGTGELLGWQTSWDPIVVGGVLAGQLQEKKQVFTGAHIVYSTPGRPKVDAIVDVCTELYDMCMGPTRHEGVTWQPLTVIARTYQKLETTFNLLRLVDCVGGFMAYEMVTDMRHTRLLEDATDIMTWANPGPGAIRGLQRLGLPRSPDAMAIQSMQKLLSRGNDRWEHPGIDSKVVSPLPQSFPMLEMRDIEHSLCEFDKYCRVLYNEGSPRAKFNGRR